MKTLAGSLAVLLLASGPALGAPPQFDAIYPAGGKRGASVEVELVGKFDPWPCQLHASGKGISFTPDPEKAGQGTLAIAADAPAGAVVLRAHNEEGASAPVLFVVDTAAGIREEEKDDSSVGKAQAVDASQLPLAIDGRLAANHELDSYRLALKKGQTLHAAVEGYALRSPVDPAIQVYDAGGNRIALVHDGAHNLDPVLAFAVPADGDYIVSVAGFAHPPATSVYFRGDKKASYRLHLALDRKHLPKRLFPEDIGPDAPAEALTAGKPVTGTIAEPGEVDRYRFAAKKGETWLVEVEGRSLGFPTDPVLRILKPDGAVLRTEDDTAKQTDPFYTWKIAADGDYEITVEDRFRAGGPDRRYRLAVKKPEPGFTATLDKSAYVLERGKPLEVKVKIERLHGHAGDLAFAIPGLPGSITLTPPEKAPEKNGDAILKLEAQGDAPAFSGPIEVRVADVPGEEKRPKIEKVATFSLKDDNWRGPYAVETLDRAWLTLPPKKEEKKPGDEKKKEAEKK